MTEICRIVFFIANYHSERETRALVGDILQIKRLGTDFEIELKIVDNSMSLSKGFEGEYESLDVKVITPRRNLGLGPVWQLAINSCAKQKNSALVLCNNDIRVRPDDLSDIVSSARCRPGCILSPVIRNPDESVWSAGGAFSPVPWRIKHYKARPKLGDSKLLPMQHLSGCFLMITPGALTKIEARNCHVSDFFFRGEEWYLNRYCENLEVPRFLITSASIYHSENSSHERFSPEHVYFAIRAKCLYLNKLHGPVFGRAWQLLYAASLMCSGGGVFLRGRTSSRRATCKAMARGFADGMKFSVVREWHVRGLNNVGS